MIKKFLKVTALAVATVSMFTMSASAFEIKSYSEDLTVYYDALKLYTDGTEKPCIMNNRVMLPLGDGFDTIIGKNKVKYDEKEEKAVFYPNGVSIEFENESFTAVQDYKDKWEEYELDVPALVYNNSFYVPIRAFGIINNIPVRWDADKKTVFINDVGTKDDIVEQFDYEKTVYEKEVIIPPADDKKDNDNDEKDTGKDVKEEPKEEEDKISEEEAIELAKEKALELFDEETIDACKTLVESDKDGYTVTFESDSENQNLEVVFKVSNDGKEVK